MAVQISKVSNANFFTNGLSHFGTASEVGLPSITSKLSDTKFLGAIGALQYHTMLEKLEATVKFNTLSNEALILSANPYSAILFQVRSSRENWSAAGGLGAQDAVYAVMGGTFADASGINFKPGEDIELSCKLNLTEYGIYVNAVELFYVNFKTQVHRVNGIDIRAQYRANLGI